MKKCFKALSILLFLYLKQFCKVMFRRIFVSVLDMKLYQIMPICCQNCFSDVILSDCFPLATNNAIVPKIYYKQTIKRTKTYRSTEVLFCFVFLLMCFLCATFFFFMSNTFLLPLQIKCPIDSADSSGKAALHHAGKCVRELRVN